MKKRNGFTLVELVIVIAVIAILATVLIPTFTGILKRANDNTTMQQMTVIRDEFISSKLDTPADIENYVFDLDGTIFTSDKNGKISIYDGTIESIELETGYSYDEVESGVSNDSIKVYVKSSEINFDEGIRLNTREIVSFEDSRISDYFVIQSSGNNRTITATNRKTALVEIKIPDTITSIADYAFYSCVNLENVEIPNSVTSIGKYAFQNCESLKTIKLSDNLTTISERAFQGCVNLKAIEIPKSVTTIGDYIFMQCSSMESIVVEDGNTVYDSRNNCNALIKTSTNTILFGCKNTIIPTTITTLGAYSFAHSKGLTEIEIPSSVKTINTYAFYYSGLTSINIPASVTSIGDYTFMFCTNLESMTVDSGNTVYDSRNNCNAIVRKSGNVLLYGCKNTTFPSTLRNIYNYAFRSCDIETVNIPNGLTTISQSAFVHCNNLKSVTIPASVTSINSSAFWWCNSLTSIVIDPNNNYYDSRDNCNAIVLKSQNRIMNGCNTTVIPSTVTSIGDSAFYFSGIEHITIPANVTSIGNYIFYGCSDLKSIVVESGNPYYDSRDNCNAIIRTSTNKLICGCMNTVIPSTVTTIGTYAFVGNSSLKTITIPSNIKTIESYAFYSSGLETISIPDSVTSLGERAFMHCEKLEEITLSSEITCINTYMFYSCLSLRRIVLPSKITSISANAFNNCKNLATIELASNLNSIGENAFYNCYNLSRVIYHGTLTNWNNISIMSGNDSLNDILIDFD